MQQGIGTFEFGCPQKDTYRDRRGGGGQHEDHENDAYRRQRSSAQRIRAPMPRCGSLVFLIRALLGIIERHTGHLNRLCGKIETCTTPRA